MSVLLGTNALIWLLLDIHRLGPEETRQLADSALFDSGTAGFGVFLLGSVHAHAEKPYGHRAGYERMA